MYVDGAFPDFQIAKGQAGVEYSTRHAFILLYFPTTYSQLHLVLILITQLSVSYNSSVNSVKFKILAIYLPFYHEAVIWYLVHGNTLVFQPSARMRS